MSDLRREDKSADFINDIENILKNVGFKTISSKNYENNEELEVLYEAFAFENLDIKYLT